MIPVPFIEALNWASKRKVMLPDEYYAQEPGIARALSFSIADVSSLDQLKYVMFQLQVAMGEGATFRQWKREVTSPNAGELQVVLPGYRLENVFRTNLQGHYAYGRCQQQKRGIEDRPWFMYDAVNDSRTRPSHAAMDGYIARHDDPVWKIWTPPCGYQCRCRRIALTDAQAKRFQERDRDNIKRDPEREIARQEALRGGPDEGWDYSPCDDGPYEGIKRAKRKITKKPIAKEPAVEKDIYPPNKPDRPQTAEEWIAEGKKIREELEKEAGITYGFASPSTSNKENIIKFRRLFKERMKARRKGSYIAVESVDQSWLNQTATKMVKGQAQFFPAEWREYSNKLGKFTIKGVEGDRSWHNTNYLNYSFEREGILLNPGDGMIYMNILEPNQVAVHEIAHRMQFAVPGLNDLYEQVWIARTAGEEAQSLNKLKNITAFKADEFAKPDKFMDPYFGKDYGPGLTEEQKREYLTPGAAAPGHGLEMIAMSMQYFAEDRTWLQFRRFANEDQDLFDLTLAVLLKY